MEINNTKQLIKVGITTFINSLGAMIFAYALSLYLLKKTGSAFSYGTSLFAGPIIGLLMSPIIGKVIDNNSHKHVAIISEVGLIITIIVFLIVFNLTNKQYVYIISVIFIVLSEIFARFFTLTYLSSTPEMVEENYHQRLNSIQSVSNSVSSIIAAPIAGVLIAKINFNYIISLEIITEIITLLMIIITKFNNLPQKKEKNNIKKINFLKDYRTIFIFSIFAVISNFMNTLMQIGVPYIIVNKLNESTEVSGNLQGLLSWGVFLGGILVTLIAFKNELKALKHIYFINFVVLALLGISVEWLPINIIIIFAIFEFVLGLINGIADPPFFTYIQSVVPRESLGQVNTYLYTIVQLLTPFGIVIYSILIESVEFQLLFLLNGFIALIIALVLLKVLKIVKE